MTTTTSKPPTPRENAEFRKGVCARLRWRRFEDETPETKPDHGGGLIEVAIGHHCILLAHLRDDAMMIHVPKIRTRKPICDGKFEWKRVEFDDLSIRGWRPFTESGNTILGKA